MIPRGMPMSRAAAMPARLNSNVWTAAPATN